MTPALPAPPAGPNALRDATAVCRRTWLPPVKVVVRVRVIGIGSGSSRGRGMGRGKGRAMFRHGMLPSGNMPTDCSVVNLESEPSRASASLNHKQHLLGSRATTGLSARQNLAANDCCCLFQQLEAGSARRSNISCVTQLILARIIAGCLQNVQSSVLSMTSP